MTSQISSNVTATEQTDQPFDDMTSSEVRGLVIEAIEAAAEFVQHPQVEAKWEEPSALAGMTVGALSAHLVRGAGAVIAYLDRTEPDREPEGELLTPTTYFHAAVDSPIHEQIKDVSATEASIGHAATVEKCIELASTMAIRLADEPDDRLVGALGGRMLTLDDFCRTRLIEVLMHLDDLAVSVGEPRPETDPRGVATVIAITMGIARHLHGDWNVLYALARAERAEVSSDGAGNGVFPVF